MSARRAVPVLVAGLCSLVLSAPPAEAQFVPYYGKNKITYDTFNWRVYRSPHFEVYYYPEFEQHLARIVSYAESAYQKVSGDLKHEIGSPIPLILYKTHSDFEQTNLYPDFLPEGVEAFAEPIRDRMVMPIDLPPDRLQGLITHELTHIFEFDLVPRTLLRRTVPLWVDEGLADYERGEWHPLDLMTLRDAAVTDQVPRLTRMASDYGAYSNPRLVYNMGHAAFEFIEARYGKEGIRQFLYTLRKNVVGGGMEDIYMQAFRVKPEQFDKDFEKWLKERFKPYRDKQRPSDYGDDLAPDDDETPFTQVFAFSPSPSGELVAAITGNRAEGEADIVLLSARDGSVVENLTKGYTDEFDSISMSHEFVAGRSLAFSPAGDTVAFFARRNKRRSLFLVSVLDKKIVRRIDIALDQAEAPALHTDGRRVIFAALREGVSDIYALDLQTEQVTNLTQDEFADAAPQISPDGTLVAYTRRISGFDKVFVFPLADPGKKTQLTFGTHEDRTPTFAPDGRTLYYASNAEDEIFNLRSLDLRTGVTRQYTDALGGNLTPAVLAGRGADRVGFITYFKGEYKLHAIDTTEPLREVDAESEDAPVELVDFQPDVVHQVIAENKRRKKLFEGLYLEGRPPINLGVSSGGDIFGGSQVALSDVLGDHTFVITALSFREFRSYEGTYINLERRLHWGASIFDNTRFFFPNVYVPQIGFGREGLFATQRYTGGRAVAEYPLDRFRRLTFTAGLLNIRERIEDPFLEAQLQAELQATGQPNPFRDGLAAPLSLGITQETTRFASFGPLAGSTFNFEVRSSPGGELDYFTLDGDARKYFRLGPTSAVLALRARGFRSTGDTPEIFYFGGNHEMRGYQYMSFAGHEGFFANVELRLPIVNVMATPIGLLGPIRGTLFGNVGGARFEGQDYNFSTREAGVSFVKDPVFGTPVSGFRLIDGRASYGFGLQFFFLGYPMHFDFSKLTDLKVSSPEWRFDYWIGFDF